MAAYLELAAHSAYDMLYKYKYLIVNSGFSHLGIWNFFLIAHFPDHFLLVRLYLFKNICILYGRVFVKMSHRDNT